MHFRAGPGWRPATLLMVLTFALDFDEYSGTVVEVDGTVAHQPSKHFRIGTGLKDVNLNLQAQKSGRGAGINY